MEAMDRLHRRMWTGVLASAACLGIGAGAFAGTQVPTPVRQHVFACTTQNCAMPDKGAYPYLVVGRFDQAASAQQSKRLFRVMRKQHHWQDLPDSPSDFRANLQPVTIRLADGSRLAVLMTREEMTIAHPQPGDLVRYSPHRGKYEIPPTDPKAAAYWAVDGCVAILCRAGDDACFKRYRTGVYRPSDGVAISARTFEPLPHHVAIDPDSLLPVRHP